MPATAPPATSISTYNNGQPYRQPNGRAAAALPGVAHTATHHAIIRGTPTAARFIATVVEEMRLRNYARSSWENYQTALRGFLRWFGDRPHRVTRDDVRRYLLFLVDAGQSSSWVSVNLSAIRTAFDKLCNRQVTLGLATPRRPTTLPVVLSEKEVRRLLEAAPRLHDKLVLALMYATGLRVSEASRIRWRDVDFDRQVIKVWQGKGKTDRQVVLPQSLRGLLQDLSRTAAPDDFVFRGERAKRHISPRTVQRIMQRAVDIAGIGKRATPHTLRHTFATHAFEYGCDIRRIQKQLGHVRLDTTTIYVKVARPSDPAAMTSPLDKLAGQQRTQAACPRVGSLRIRLDPQPSENGLRRALATLLIRGARESVELAGIGVREIRPGWVTLEIPPFETWQATLSRLTTAEQQRIAEPAFFEILQHELPRRLLQQPPAPT